MTEEYINVEKCVKQIRKITDFVPKVAVVLGSGLGDFADDIQVECTIPYKDIIGFPVSTVSGHKGQFVFGYVEDVPVVIMQGRVHYYEGYSTQEVVRPTRIMAALGAQILLLTNSAGGINLNYTPGDFMLIRDHISSFVPSPLIGENEDKWGQRFPAMDNVYDKETSDKIAKAAKTLDIPLQEGVYLQFSGPNYETKSEVRMCGILGADAVGMSTAIEAMAGCHMGMKVCGISCISNMGCGLNDVVLKHEEVTEMGAKKAPDFKRLLKQSILNMGKL